MQNTEIEIKLFLSFEQFTALKEKFGRENIPCCIEEQKDIYFSPKLNCYFGKAVNDECLRIRIENSKSVLNYKHIIFGEDELDIHIQQFETEISDVSQTILILNALNIKEVLTVQKTRYKYLYKDSFEISLDEVKDLGYFIEIEIINKDQSVQLANKMLIEVTDELKLDVSQRNLEGYSNLMFFKITAEHE